MTKHWTVFDRSGREIYMTLTTTPDWLFTYIEQPSTGQQVEIEYDREGDTLEILFARGSGRGVELSDEIVLRYDSQTKRPLSLIFIKIPN